MKSLVAYYSRSENTRKVAEYIRDLMGADMFEIVPVEPYPESFQGCIEMGREQLEKGILPPVKDAPKDLSEYDVIFIGSPNWFNTMVPVVHTFADAYDFAGKKVAPFCTHGTKGAYKVVADIAQAAKNAEIIPGFGAYSQTMDEKTQVEVKLWLTGNGLIKPEN